MTPEGFDTENWVERLAAILPALAEAQGPYLEDYWRLYPPTHRIMDGSNVNPFPPDDVRMVYMKARYSRRFGEEARYAPLRRILDSVRHTLLSHPTLERVAVTGRLVGENEFWMGIVNSGSSISAGDLIAGLMARAAELPGDGFRTAAQELSAFLSPAGAEETAGVLGNLDEGCDAMLFCGLVVTERIEVRDEMEIIPYRDIRRFVDEKYVRDLAPGGAGFHGWRSVGAVVRPFRWRPVFRRVGNVNEPMSPPDSFFPDAAAFLDLLAVSHAAPVVPLAALSGRIDKAAGRLLGREKQSLGFYQSWPAQGVDGFAECPALSAEALEDVREVFKNRENARYHQLAHIVNRLAQALARDGRFAIHDKVLDVSIALEGMFDLPRRGVTKALEERVAGFLGVDAEDRNRIGENARTFYNARSAIIHNRSAKATPFTNSAAFITGFELARRSLFKMLREGAPDNRDKLAVASK